MLILLIILISSVLLGSLTIFVMHAFYPAAPNALFLAVGSITALSYFYFVALHAEAHLIPASILLFALVVLFLFSFNSWLCVCWYNDLKASVEKTPFPSGEDFLRTVSSKYERQCAATALPPLRDDLYALILNTCGALYQAENFPDPDTIPNPPLRFSRNVDVDSISLAYEKQIDFCKQRLVNRDLILELMSDACCAMIFVYTKGVGSLKPASPFLVSVVECPSPIGAFIADLIRPFFEPQLVELNLFASIRDPYSANRALLTQTLSKKQQQQGIVFNPQDHKGAPLQVLDAFLTGTPLHDLFTTTNLPLSDDVRFAHQWVMANPRLGKTTLLSAQINFDLDRVRDGECSLFILDSQNDRLTHHLPRLARFGPGGDLYGKLVYLEPDADYPLALNIFDFQTADYREAEMMTLTFMSSFAETSEHMKNVIKYALQALAKIPDATVFTFKDLLDRKGKAEGMSGFDLLAKDHPELIALDPDTKRFLSRSMFEGQYAASIGAVKARLDGFTADPMFKAMFRHPRSRFNLFEELAAGKVVIINANEKKLQDAREPFGRYFISRLLQTARSRLGGQAGKLPLFAYIDEAQDYIKSDHSIQNLLFQARKQNVGLVISHHSTSQLDADVAAALESAAIKCRPIRQGYFNFEIEETQGKRSFSVTVPHVDFAKMPRMSTVDWWAILGEMRQRYCVPKEPTTVDEARDEARVEIIPPQREVIRRKKNADDAMTEPSEDY